MGDRNIEEKVTPRVIPKMRGSAQGGKGQTWKWRSISFHRTVKKTHYQVQGPQLSPRERCMLLNVNHVNLCLMRRCTTSQATYRSQLIQQKPTAQETKSPRDTSRQILFSNLVQPGGDYYRREISTCVNSRFHGQCWRMEVFLSHGLQCQDQGLLTGVRWHITSTKP